MDPNQTQQASEILANAREVLVFSGSGISVESGLKTYRGEGGLWDGQPVEVVAHPQGFADNPALVWEWYNTYRQGLAALAPNAGHRALAALEKTLVGKGGKMTVATQNIDGLHQAAGSTNVLEVHGSVHRVRCCKCNYRDFIGLAPMVPVPPPCPACGDLLRPAVVWFTEPLPRTEWEAAVTAAMTCDAFITVGTSAVVYPAAGLIQLAVERGIPSIEVNLDPTAFSSKVSVSLRGRAGEVLPILLQ
jgi:NAD-dependent deacetylase